MLLNIYQKDQDSFFIVELRYNTYNAYLYCNGSKNILRYIFIEIIILSKFWKLASQDKIIYDGIMKYSFCHECSK